MQHIPRAVHSFYPCDPRSLQVPLFVNDKYDFDGQDFLAIPKANGFGLRVVFPIASHVQGYETSEKRDYYNSNLFLQEWGFFGLLAEVCNVFDCEFQRSNFVEGDSPQFATTLGLPLLAARLEQRKLQLSDDEIRRRNDRLSECVLEVRSQVVEAMKKAERSLERTPQLTGFLRDRFICVPLCVLLLAEAVESWVRSDNASSLSKDQKQLVPHQRGTCPSLVLIHLQSAGWCPLEIQTITTYSSHNTSFMMLASSLDRRRLERRHQTLPANEAVCDCEIVDRETYSTFHAPLCQDCISSISTHEWLKVENAVKVSVTQRRLPVLTVTSLGSVPAGGLQTELEVYNAHHLGILSRYIAISHLWADGLGAQDRGRLPDCQLRRVQELVDDLVNEYPCEFQANVESASSAHFPFWLDTICVPNSDNSLADLARASMTNIYGKALAVLVLDATIYDVDFKDEEPEVSMTRIALSRWATRGWTFQESACARKVFFRFKDRNVTFSEVDDLYFKKLALRRGIDVPNPDSYMHPVMQKFRLRSADPCYDTAYRQVENMLNWTAELEKPFAHRLELLWHRLRRRIVSVAEDEAFIIGGLLQSAGKLDVVPGHERMRSLFMAMPSFPTSMIFHLGPRYRQEGSRWIPKSVLRLSGDPAKREWRWTSMTKGEIHPPALVTSNGLLVWLKGVRLDPLPPLSELSSRTVLVEVKGESYFLAGCRESPKDLLEGLISNELVLLFPPDGLGPNYPCFVPGTLLLVSLRGSVEVKDATAVVFEKLIFAHQVAAGVPIDRESFLCVSGNPIEIPCLWCIG